MAEQLGLEQGLRQRGAADLHERVRVALAGPMQRLRHQLLAGAGLAGDQDGRVGPRHLADELEDLQHRPRAAHDPLAVGGALAELQAEGGDLVAHVGVLEDPLQRGEQVVHLERLRDVVVGAVLHGLDGAGAAAEGGHHDDFEVGILALQLPEDGEPVLVGQLDVHHHEVGHLLGDGRDALGPGRGVLRLVPGILQQVCQEIPDLGLVIDDEDRSRSFGQ